MLPMLSALFKYTSMINPKARFYKHAFVQAKDFRDLLNQSDLIGYNLNEKEAYVAFLLSMMT